ncbi:MAG: ribosome biogenesis GTPase Der [Rhodospirillales bacterium]|nr:MAG: ribosome biogenesis GTPase Der [Rhodospirillales bacterium]
MTFTVAIVGRPNVGKSTLFNRLVGKRLALVDDTPGVTRDWREGEARIADLRFRVLDTAGLEDAAPESLAGRMSRQTLSALAAADVALLLIDARAGITPVDQHFAAELRKRTTPVILIANKCEGRGGEIGLTEAFSLGLGDPVPISAEHGEGMGDLYEALRAYAEASEPSSPGAEGATEAAIGEPVEGGRLQLAIVGRPNVGKSTLINKLVGAERLLTGPEAGITRDAIAVDWEFKGHPIRLIDTAGLRRRARISEKLEKLSGADTMRAARYAQVVVLMLDAEAMLEKQDLTIARHVVDEGRALVVAANKWDLVRDKRAALNGLRERLADSLPQVRGVPVVTISALEGRNLDKLMDAVVRIYGVWNRRVPTAKLNDWLALMTESHPPPLAAGRRVRLRYMTQIKTRPPSFAIWTSRPQAVPDSYIRYLMNGLRDAFGLAGVPLRIHLRKGRNPYEARSRSRK